MKYVKSIENMTKDEIAQTGGKAAMLGELTRAGFNVPPGFCVTGASLDYVLESGNLWPEINAVMESMNFDSYKDIEDKAVGIREVVENAPIPQDLRDEITENINGMKDSSGADPFVAVRSSVAVKDSAISSFPGMMDTYHFIKGEEEIISYIRKCWASLFTDRALYRRHQQNIPQDKGIIAPIVQRMVNADVAGVMFTANAVSSARDEIVIESNWGLGESLVSGEALVDYFVVTRTNPPQVKQKKIAKKNIMVTIDREKGIGRKKYELSEELSNKCSLTDEQLMELAEIGPRIEALFGVPQDIEWAYENNELFFLQSRKIKGLK